MTTPDACPHQSRAKRIRQYADALADAVMSLILPAAFAGLILVLVVAGLLDAIRG